MALRCRDLRSGYAHQSEPQELVPGGAAAGDATVRPQTAKKAKSRIEPKRTHGAKSISSGALKGVEKSPCYSESAGPREAWKRPDLTPRSLHCVKPEIGGRFISDFHSEISHAGNHRQSPPPHWRSGLMGSCGARANDWPVWTVMAEPCSATNAEVRGFGESVHEGVAVELASTDTQALLDAARQTLQLGSTGDLRNSRLGGFGCVAPVVHGDELLLRTRPRRVGSA